ncbi:MAG: HAD family hydrolase [Candidatus Eremiobacteraeota bacterium]|nr:HAD family hydrolase [Candidatus Eremiobacteraeota bacterium]
MLNEVETILFDIDGTLVDSNDPHALAWVDALAEGGFDVPFTKIRPFIGMGGDKLVPALDLGLTEEEEPGTSIVANRKKIFLERYVGDVRPFPGARELVAACRERGLRRIVASSSSPEELTPLLKIAGIENLFDHAMSPNEVKETKPDPDIIAAALAWSGSEPGQTVMIGDTRYDAEAAARAGVRMVALRSGGSPEDDLRAATAIYDDPAALVAALRDSTFDDLLPRPGQARSRT